MNDRDILRYKLYKARSSAKNMQLCCCKKKKIIKEIKAKSCFIKQNLASKATKTDLSKAIHLNVLRHRSKF